MQNMCNVQFIKPSSLLWIWIILVRFRAAGITRGHIVVMVRLRPIGKATPAYELFEEYSANHPDFADAAGLTKLVKPMIAPGFKRSIPDYKERIIFTLNEMK